jgi:hypothetical protein
MEQRLNKTEEPSEEGYYTVSPLHPETCPVYRANVTTSTLIHVVPCILIHLPDKLRFIASRAYFYSVILQDTEYPYHQRLHLHQLM